MTFLFFFFVFLSIVSFLFDFFKFHFFCILFWERTNPEGTEVKARLRPKVRRGPRPIQKERKGRPGPAQKERGGQGSSYIIIFCFYFVSSFFFIFCPFFFFFVFSLFKKCLFFIYRKTGSSEIVI